MFSNMQAILANLVVPVVRLLLFIAAYAAIKFIQTKAAIYKAKKEAKIRDQEHAARIRRAKRSPPQMGWQPIQAISSYARRTKTICRFI